MSSVSISKTLESVIDSSQSLKLTSSSVSLSVRFDLSFSNVLVKLSVTRRFTSSSQFESKDISQIMCSSVESKVEKFSLCNQNSSISGTISYIIQNRAIPSSIKLLSLQQISSILALQIFNNKLVIVRRTKTTENKMIVF